MNEHSIAAAISALVCGLLTVWAVIGRPWGDPRTGTLVFRYNSVVRGFALLFALGPSVALMALLFLEPPKDESEVWILILLQLFFGLTGGYFVWETFRFAVAVALDGIYCCSPWRGKRFIPWDEVEKVSFVHICSWFIIQATDGWKFRVPMLLPGLSELLESLEMHLPLEALVAARRGYRRVGRPFPEWHQEPG